MRSEYDFLTEATKDGLTDRVKAAAKGWLKSGETIYQILRGEKQDPYAYFRSFYEGMCEGGVPTTPWDGDMAYLREKHSDGRQVREATEAFKDKYHGGSELVESYMSAIADGTLDLDETTKLLDLIAIEKPLTATLEKALLAHKVKLERAEEEGSPRRAQRARRS